MGTAQNSHLRHRNKHVIISLLFLLLSSSILLNFVAEGRALSKLVGDAKEKADRGWKMGIRNQVIGSTPPRCDRKCSSCGHCEAIQVPITPTRFLGRGRSHSLSTSVSNIVYYRGDDISNYKPISWKCKCGNLIFNP